MSNSLICGISTLLVGLIVFQALKTSSYNSHDLAPKCIYMYDEI